MKELEIAPFFITRYFIDLDNMTVIHYFEKYSEVLQLLEEAKKIYKMIKQKFVSDIYIVEYKGEIEYKVVIKLLEDARR